MKKIFPFVILSLFISACSASSNYDNAIKKAVYEHKKFAMEPNAPQRWKWFDCEIGGSHYVSARNSITAVTTVNASTLELVTKDPGFASAACSTIPAERISAALSSAK